MLVKNYLNQKKLIQEATRVGFGRGLVMAAKRDKQVVGLCCDLTDSTKMMDFKKEFPQRFFEIGVAEQNMAGVAAGLALSGKVPFMASYAVFSPGRNWDQIRVSICYNRANVKIVGAHAGISVGPDGATHQALEDIALIRSLPHMTVVAPADSLEAAKATLAAAKLKGPVYLRLARSATPVFTTSRSSFRIGQAEVLLEGKDLLLIGAGPILYQALLAAAQLREQDIRATVINCHTIKPLDQKTILKWARKTKAVVTVEEHQVNGGLGGAVAELLAKKLPLPQEFVAMPDSFGESGQPEELLKKYKMTADDVVKAGLKVLKRKSKI